MQELAPLLDLAPQRQTSRHAHDTEQCPAQMQRLDGCATGQSEEDLENLHLYGRLLLHLKQQDTL